MSSNKSKVKKVYTIQKKLRITMLFFFFILLLLIIRLGFLQFIQGADLKEKMYKQLIASDSISPKRGTIYDSTGKALASSVPVDTISIDPSIIVAEDNGKVSEEKTKELKEKLAKAFSDIFELNYEETLEKVLRDTTYVKIASKVEKDKVDKLKEWMEKEDFYTGININEDTKRYYPYENLASSLIGFCGTDNQGLEGLEAYWDTILTGTPGKITNAKDAVRSYIPDDNQTYIPPENGSDITLTIDANIQAIVEKYLKQACIENKCDRGGNVIAMNPKNGDILAMATYPDYNLNTPFNMPSSVKEKDWKKLNSEEQTATIKNLYRNRVVADTYEPGSVFKIVTTSIAIEESLATPDKKGAYYCNSTYTVSGISIGCALGTAHGSQSLQQALANSCNSAYIQINQKIGAKTAYRYYDAFGLFSKTGIEAAGEADDSIFWALDNVGPLELATMSFGQRFKITPLQMVTAVSAIANNGILMKPRIVKEMKDTDTGAITTIDPIQVRQVVSKETANTLMTMLGDAVDSGAGKYAKVKGYSIAGKSGTSEPDPSNPSEGYTASFVAVSPTENPEIVLLITLYNPKGSRGYFGGTVAAPVASQILSEVLPYMQVPSDGSNESSSKTTSLPDVTNKTVAEAKKLIEKAGFICSTSGKSEDIVKAQYPVKGSSLIKNSIVKLYTETENTRVSKPVPNLIGKNLTQVKSLLKDQNLNLSISGSGTVVTQDPIAGTSVEEGTIVKVTLAQ